MEVQNWLMLRLWYGCQYPGTMKIFSLSKFIAQYWKKLIWPTYSYPLLPYMYIVKILNVTYNFWKSLVHVLTIYIWVTWRVSYKRQELLTLRKYLGLHPTPGFWWGSVLLILLVLCVVLCFCFVCLHPVSCVSSVASVSGLFILDCPFRFL